MLNLSSSPVCSFFSSSSEFHKYLLSTSYVPTWCYSNTIVSRGRPDSSLMEVTAYKQASRLPPVQPGDSKEEKPYSHLEERAAVSELGSEGSAAVSCGGGPGLFQLEGTNVPSPSLRRTPSLSNGKYGGTIERSGWRGSREGQEWRQDTDWLEGY